MRSLTWLGFLFLVCSATAARADSDIGDAFVSGLPKPDARVLKAAKLGLERYRESRPYKKEWVIEIDEQKGVIETNWFPEHKGEVQLKVQVVVWGESFRVDVWQKVGWLVSSIEKTDWSRRTERSIQDTIKTQLTTGTP
ncbi:MAG: hypothetical protein L0214_11635 [candidate division NC10 bacterium]|nr:hypothetical protein [candidate division NC10 bacterium]